MVKTSFEKSLTKQVFYKGKWWKVKQVFYVKDKCPFIVVESVDDGDITTINTGSDWYYLNTKKIRELVCKLQLVQADLKEAEDDLLGQYINNT